MTCRMTLAASDGALSSAHRSVSIRDCSPLSKDITTPDPVTISVSIHVQLLDAFVKNIMQLCVICVQVCTVYHRLNKHQTGSNRSVNMIFRVDSSC